MDGSWEADPMIEQTAHMILARIDEAPDHEAITKLAQHIKANDDQAQISAAIVFCFEDDIREWFGEDFCAEEDEKVRSTAKKVAEGHHRGAIYLFAEMVAGHSDTGRCVVQQIHHHFVGLVREGKFDE